MTDFSEYQRRARTTAPEHSVQRDVEVFHRALDVPVGDTPAIRRPELRADLIEEEAKETVDAIRRGDLVEAIDGMCDVLCVVYGTAAEFGVDLAPFWDEVHRTNMAKVGGPVREDGKRLKPEGWTPPDIAGLLAAVTPTPHGYAHVADRTPCMEPLWCGRFHVRTPMIRGDGDER